MAETARDSAARYRANLQGEVDSAGLYRALHPFPTYPFPPPFP